MDRLQTVSVLCAALLSAACDDGPRESSPAAEVSGRVVAVAAPKDQGSESDLCDELKSAESAPTFSYPALDQAAVAPKPGAWRWINVWASWCQPCVEEMPLITRLRNELDKAGAKIDLVYVSVDQTPEAMAGFQATHPEAKGSLRLSDFKTLEAWLTSVGLDAGATLPIHLFVDPNGKVRCARTGAVRESDLPLLKKLVSS